MVDIVTICHSGVFRDFGFGAIVYVLRMDERLSFFFAGGSFWVVARRVGLFPFCSTMGSGSSVSYLRIAN